MPIHRERTTVQPAHRKQGEKAAALAEGFGSERLVDRLNMADLFVQSTAEVIS